MNGNMIGRVFNNRYKITERIGVGGMAEVYRAQDQVLGRVVAVKVMLPQYAADQEFTRRFRQEAAAAANLQSPYIMNVYDWGQDEGTYYIVMEFVRGSDLKTGIQARGALNQRKVAEIGSQVCQALAVAHNQDIIHRDIKPQNIMVQPDGNVKVMDFGIARAKNSMKSQTSTVLGTAHYISPEQAQGKELTPASDIYSLGVVLYEAATGKLPFDGPDSISVAMKQVSDYPVPPSQVNPSVDPALEAIIMHALEKDPTARFATVNDMKKALTDFLAGRSVGMDENATHVMNPAVVPPMSSSTMVMPPVEGRPSHQNNMVSRDFDEPNKGGKGPKKGVLIAVAVIAAIAIIAGAVFALGSNMNKVVPDVKGKTVAEATTLLEHKGYKVGSTTEVYDESVEPGRVISSDPDVGTKLEKGSTVNLTVSKGKEQVAVPDVTGKSASEAEQILSKAGLSGKEGTAEYSSDVPEGKVIRTDPSTGSKVDTGATVTYVVSKGSETSKVPNVVGMDQSEATRAIEKAGFMLGSVTKQSSKTVAEGQVISQNPSAGTKVAKDSAISIVISTGAPEAPASSSSSKSSSSSSSESSSKSN